MLSPARLEELLTSPFTANEMLIFAASIPVDFSLIATLLVVASSLISAVVSAVAFTLNTDFAIKSLKKDIKDLRRNSSNAIIHVEGLVRNMQGYLYEATKENPNIKTYYIRETQTGHTGADFLKDE